MKKIILFSFLSVLFIGQLSAQNQLVLTTSVTAATACITPCNGTATVTNVTGGTPPYTYLWNIPLAPQQTQTATGLCPGTYQIGVFDASTPLPKQGQAMVTIVCVTTGVSDYMNSENDIVIFPNPVCNELFLHANEPVAGKIEISVTNMLGETSKIMEAEMYGTASSSIDISNLTPGVYSIKMIVNGELIRKKFVKQ